VGDVELLVRCLDLTSLRGDETDDDIRRVCHRAAVHSVAAVVVFAGHVRTAKSSLAGTYIKVATVGGGFPGASRPLADRLADARHAVDTEPDELDVVFDRRLVAEDHLDRVRDEVAMLREVAGSRPMKVIIETAELGSQERVRAAALAACVGGADFVKSSTGKAGPATLEAVHAMVRGVHAFRERTGNLVGIKVAGGIRTKEQALAHLELVRNDLGDEWLTPGLFRIGASALLDDLVGRPA
jgi:deoxyribose-phosphate aldolase